MPKSDQPYCSLCYTQAEEIAWSSAYEVEDIYNRLRDECEHVG